MIERIPDLISYTRDTGYKLHIIPGEPGEYIRLRMIDPASKNESRRTITESEIAGMAAKDLHIHLILNEMVEEINLKKAREAERKLDARQMREREKLFRGE